VNRTQVMNNLGRTPLSFEPNVGQTASRVDYLTHTGGATVFLTPTAAVFAMQKPSPGLPSEDPSTVAGIPSPMLATPGSNGGTAVYMHMVGANPVARPVGQEELSGKVNYFIGNNPSKWHTNIPTFGRVEYPNVLDGIDLAYYGGPNGLEYDFTVRPGADPQAIALDFRGADGVELDAQGDLVVHTTAGDLVQHSPVVYQNLGGQHQPVAGRFVLGSGQVRFDVGAYDRSRPVVIDPVVLGYSSFLGGAGDDEGSAVAVAPDGSAYVTGDTRSADFPTTPGAFDSTFAGGTCGNVTCADVFVSKLNPSGTALAYSTYLGGNDDDVGLALALAKDGSTYLTGFTASSKFPVARALQPVKKGPLDAFVTRLNASGSALLFSTYLGGTNDEGGYGIAVDPVGGVYVTGFTGSADFPTVKPLQAKFGGVADGFLTKLNARGSAILYSTYLGGSQSDQGWAIAVDASGNAYITGGTSSADFPTANALQPAFAGNEDAFVAGVNAAGTALVYSTYLGGRGGEYGSGVALDTAGSAYVTGFTTSRDFPTAHAYQAVHYPGNDAFVTKISPGGASLDYSTYLGGAGTDDGIGIVVDAGGDAYVTGATGSADFPTAGALQPVYGGGVYDGFVTEFNAAGSGLVFSTFLGGEAFDDGLAIARGADGSVYLTGIAASTDFPTTAGAYDTTQNGQSDAFVAKLSAS
jgi:hypothetical protein